MLAFHSPDGALLRMQNDSQDAINDVLATAKRAAGEACRIIPGIPQEANITGSGSVQESAMAAANICARRVQAPQPMLGNPYNGLGGYSGGFGDDASTPIVQTVPVAVPGVESDPWYKNWKVWAAVGGAVVGGVTVGVIIGKR